MSKRSVSIIIPTCQRPVDLLAAVRSLFNQSLLEKTACTLIIVDNDPAASAAEAIKRLQAECPDNLKFIADHEPRAGVANARNCAIAHVNSDLIAFLDDDQSAGDAQWLERLYRLHEELHPSVIFGRVETVLPRSVTQHNAYFKHFFERADPSPRGLIPHYHGAGNTMLDVSQLPAQRPLFEASANETGGEDDLLFELIGSLGGKFAWAPDAFVYERVPARRAKLGYTLRRALVYGQGPTNRAIYQKRFHLVFLWMCVGIGKVLMHGTLAALGFLVKAPNRAHQLDLAMRGLGKIMFWQRFSLYGQAALRDGSLLHKEEITPAPEG